MACPIVRAHAVRKPSRKLVRGVKAANVAISILDASLIQNWTHRRKAHKIHAAPMRGNSKVGQSRYWTMNTPLADHQREFLTAELEQVRKDYDGYVEGTRKLERYAILVTGAIWSWCASHDENVAFRLMAWFPFVACALFGLRAAAIHFQARAARQFSVRIEQALGLPGDWSWSRDQQLQSRGVPSLVAATAYVFWFIVSTGTLLVPIIFSHYRLASPIIKSAQVG
jgi:hypothetical protein